MSSSKAKSSRGKKGKSYFPWFFMLRVILILSCIVGSWLLWLDHRIQLEFEGKRWALPARVYASPTEIFAGQRLTITEFEAEIRSLGYKKQQRLDGDGVYRRNNNIIEIKKRRFVYWDKEEGAEQYKLQFSSGSLSRIDNQASGQTETLFRLEPQLIGKIFPHHNEDRLVVPYREVPPFLIAALVAVEDRQFFSHSGVDFRGILRAILVNLKSGKIRQGGSTLTQQLVKNYFLTAERTFWRKFNELIMSLLLEMRYSKADILAAYINEIYLGQHGARGIHGFGTAAEYYFGRPLAELRDDQIALLVGMVKGASYYNPFRHPERAKSRRNLVLRQMGDLKYANTAEMARAETRGLDLASKPNWGGAKYPAFVDLVKRQLLRDYRLEDLRSEGLRIFTTLDAGLQDKIERLAERMLKEIEKNSRNVAGSLQLAVLVQQVSSGEIMGVIGGREREDTSFNRAIDAYRPIGSLIKPLVYYAALNSPDRYNVLTRLNDKTISIQQADGTQWRPKNYDRKEHGNISLLEAITHSYNIASVRLGMEIGLSRIIAILNDLGIEKSIDPYPSLLLGALELSPMQVNSIYQGFANGGFQVEATAIREVLTKTGRPLHRYPLEVEESLAPGAVFLTNFMMQQVISKGTARSLATAFPSPMVLAGKTGTTNNLRDSWFVGFGDNLLATTWLGLDNNSSSRLTGASGAMKIWGEIMRVSGIRSLNSPAPESISWLNLTGDKCPGLEKVPYLRGFKPDLSYC